MNDSMRSITVLAMAFVGVVVVTLGLAAVIVPSPASSAQDPGAGSPGPSAGGGGAARPSVPFVSPDGTGGVLAVSGDREGSFVLSHEALEERYALVGDDGRVIFDGRPIEIVQISYDGLEFFPDPDECTITPGELDTTTGVGKAAVLCDGLRDVRDNGVVTLSGEIGLPVGFLADVDLPPSGGSLAVGDETWTFEGAFMLAWQLPVGGTSTDYNMNLVDEVAGGGLHFLYDIHTHATSVAAVSHDTVTAPVAGEACSVSTNELGRYSPRAAIVEMTIDCPGVEVPGIGTVPIRGTVVVEQLEHPV